MTFVELHVAKSYPAGAVNRAKCLPFGFPLQSWFLRPALALVLVLRFSVIIPKRAELSLKEKYDARKGQRRQVNPPKSGGSRRFRLQKTRSSLMSGPSPPTVC